MPPVPVAVDEPLVRLLAEQVPAGAGTLHYTLGGAVLVELALLGRVEIAEGRAALNGPAVRAVGHGPLPDPLLQAAHDEIAEKSRRVQPLLLAIGADLRKEVIERLLERGLIRRDEKRVLGVFRMSVLPAEDGRRESELREQIRAVLEHGGSPDPRTAAVIALISASGTLPSLRPALVPWTSEVIRRAKALENGNWGAAAVSTAVTRTAAAIAASSAAVAVTTVTTVTGS